MELGISIVGLLTMVVIKGLVVGLTVKLLLLLSRSLRTRPARALRLEIPARHREAAGLLRRMLWVFLAAELVCAVETTSVPGVGLFLVWLMGPSAALPSPCSVWPFIAISTKSSSTSVHAAVSVGAFAAAVLSPKESPATFAP